jgi:hypothetical protein
MPTTRKYEVGYCFNEGCSFALFLICKGPGLAGISLHFFQKKKAGGIAKKFEVTKKGRL